MGDLYGGQNVVLSGFALSVVSGMQVQVGAGVCYADGIYAVTSPVTLNINTTSTSPRYTIIRVTVTPNNPSGTDGTTGNSLIADTNAVDVLDGSAGSSPSKPTLTSAYQVQVGSILVPANTNVLTAGMLNTLDCAPNSLYDPSPLTNANTHRAASLLSATVHDVTATTAGGAGGANANKLALTDANGRVGDSNLLGGLAPASYQPAGSYDTAGAAGAVQTILNAHEAAVVTAGPVHGESVRRGLTGQQTCNNQQQVSWPVTFSPAFPNGVIPDITGLTPIPTAPYNQQYGSQIYATGVTNTGMTIYFGQTSGGAVTLAVNWRAEAGS